MAIIVCEKAVDTIFLCFAQTYITKRSKWANVRSGWDVDGLFDGSTGIPAVSIEGSFISFLCSLSSLK